MRPGHHLSHYLSSHDTDGALYTLQGDRDLFRLAVGLQMTAAGIPCIYYGEEVGRPGGIWPDNRSDMPWGERSIAPGAGQPRDEDLRVWYRRLIAVRRAHPALRRGERKGLEFGKDFLVFHRHDPVSDEHLLVAANRAASPVAATVSLPGSWPSGGISDLLDGAEFRSTEGILEVEIPARGLRILAVDP